MGFKAWLEEKDPEFFKIPKKPAFSPKDLSNPRTNKSRMPKKKKERERSSR
jgi:hypothetical protein